MRVHWLSSHGIVSLVFVVGLLHYLAPPLWSRPLFNVWQADIVRSFRHLIKVAYGWGCVEPAALDRDIVYGQNPIFSLADFLRACRAEPEGAARHLTRDEFKALLDNVTTPHVRLFLLLAISTGGRARALFDLRWSQVNFDDNYIALEGREGEDRRGKRRATVPMTNSLRAALLDAKERAETPYVIEYRGAEVRSIKTALNAAARRLGFKVTPHMLRHSACVWMAQADVPLIEIANLLGHSNLAMVSRVYGKFRPSFMTKAREALEI